MTEPKGVGDVNCPILKCCRMERKVASCGECNNFPNQPLKQAKTLHPDWLEDQAKLPLKKE